MKHRILNSLLFAVLLSFALMLVLVSCGGDSGGNVASIAPSQQPGAGNSPQVQPSGDVQSGDVQPANTGVSAPIGYTPGEPEQSPAPSAESPADQSPAQADPTPASPAPVPSVPSGPLTMEQAYRAALETIYRDHRYPNGDEVDVPSDAAIEDNSFAIYDVDGDGVDELIFQNDNCSMASMMTTVYSFDSSTGTLYQELSGFVGMTFYNNGVVTIIASHNQGLGQMEDFWPYAIYQYDPGSDGYLMAAYVDGWDGTFFPEDWEGNPFPSDIDQDGDLAVYILSSPGAEVTTTTVDGPEYEQWLYSYLGGASQLDLPWKSMTLENIQAVAP